MKTIAPKTIAVEINEQQIEFLVIREARTEVPLGMARWYRILDKKTGTPVISLRDFGKHVTLHRHFKRHNRIYRHRNPYGRCDTLQEALNVVMRKFVPMMYVKKNSVCELRMLSRFGANILALKKEKEHEQRLQHNGAKPVVGNDRLQKPGVRRQGSSGAASSR